MRAGHDADLVSVPFKWYPGARVLTQAFLWRMLDLDEADGRPVDVVVATKFPSYVVRHREKRVWLVHQFRQAYELDGTDLGQFGPSPEERALRRRVQQLDRLALGEATQLFATSANVAGRLERSTGLVAEVLPHPPQALPYRVAPSQGFVLSASRLDRAKRIDLLLEAAALEQGLEVVIASDGPDRKRLEEIARARDLDGRVRFEGRVDAERLAELYATCSSVYYAPVDEDFGMGPYEAFLSGKPVITTTDAGGPLDVVHDRRTGLVVRPDAAEVGRAAAWLREHADDAAAFGAAGKALADEVTWDRAIARLLVNVRVAYFSPMPPEASGIADYSALLVPALREHVDLTVVKRGTKRPPRGSDLAVYHIGNNPEAHGWILDALRRVPGARRAPRLRPPSPRRGCDDRSQGRPRLSRRDGAGSRRRRTAPRPRRARQAAAAALGGAPRGVPPDRRSALLATGLVVHSRFVEDRARAAGFAGPIFRVAASGVARSGRRAGRDRRRPADRRRSGTSTSRSGSRSCSRRSPAFARSTRAPGSSSSAPSSPGFDLERRLQRLGLSGDGIVREGYVDERRLWELMAACDVHVSLRSPTMGETSGTAIRALTLGKPLVVSDVGWFSELPETSRSGSRSATDEVAELEAALRLLAERPEVRDAMAAAARQLAVGEHALAAVAERQAAAFETLAGGRAIADEVLGDVSVAAAGVGIAPGTPEADEIARRLAEVDLGG